MQPLLHQIMKTQLKYNPHPRSIQFWQVFFTAYMHVDNTMQHYYVQIPVTMNLFIGPTLSSTLQLPLYTIIIIAVVAVIVVAVMVAVVGVICYRIKCGVLF